MCRRNDGLNGLIKLINGWKTRWTNEWMEWLDGWIDGWIDGWMDGQMDRIGSMSGCM